VGDIPKAHTTVSMCRDIYAIHSQIITAGVLYVAGEHSQVCVWPGANIGDPRLVELVLAKVVGHCPQSVGYEIKELEVWLVQTAK